MKLYLYLFAILIISSLAVIKGQELCYPDVERVDCHPDLNDTEEACLERGCFFCAAHTPDQNVPTCFLPKDYGYSMVGEPINTENGVMVNLLRTSTDTMFGGDALNLTLEAEFQSDYRLRIKITDGTPRWEVPLPIDPPSGGNSARLYDIIFTNVPVFSFKVLRRSTGTTLFDTSLGGLTFSDQFIQLGIKLPSRNVYGLGENEQHSFRHSFDDFPRWVLWAKDLPPRGSDHIYGVQPHYTVLEEDGNAHAVIIVNSNAQEWVMHPHPGIVYRTIGGLLDIYMFLGPTPEKTVQQYTEAVGRFPLPPYWSLGFQLCRYGYDHIDKMKLVVDRTIESEIPYDVQYGDIDIMDRQLDFTVDPINFAGLNDYVKELRTKGIRFITILDPAISIGEPNGTYRPYELGNEMDVWIKKQDGTPMVGRVWPPDPVSFPDYFKNSTREWWRILITEMYNQTLQFDALWIDMNEPANFITGDINDDGCPQNSINNPVYLPRVVGGSLYDKTLCPDHVDSMGLHYNTHSLYGWSESEPTIVATRAAVGDRRTFALSRSTYLGTGRWVTHWLGDNFSTWDNMYYSIIGMLQFNLFGIPFVGPDICGHQGDPVPTAEMCGRWMQLGAFYPFSRNHNAKGREDQDPAAFNGSIIAISKAAMTTRYRLLPYLYTLLAIHSMSGDTVARPLWFEFPSDPVTAGVDRQFLWGSGLLISPVLEPGALYVRAYFPDERFYDLYTGQEVPARKRYLDVSAAFTENIPVHVRGGSILPIQEPAVNTELARQNPLGLIVACDDNNEAVGSFYYDAGESVDPIESGQYFWADIVLDQNGSVLSYSVKVDGYTEMRNQTMGSVIVMGGPTRTAVRVNGQPHTNFTTSPTTGQLSINSLMLNAHEGFVIEML